MSSRTNAWWLVVTGLAQGCVVVNVLPSSEDDEDTAVSAGTTEAPPAGSEVGSTGSDTGIDSSSGGAKGSETGLPPTPGSSTDSGSGPSTDTGLGPSTSTDTDTSASTDTGTDTDTSASTDTGTDTSMGSSTDTSMGSSTDTSLGSSTDTGLASSTDTGLASTSDTGSSSDTDTSTGGDVPGCGNGVIEPPEICLLAPVGLDGGPGERPTAYVHDDFTDDGFPDLVVMSQRIVTINATPGQVDVFEGGPVSGLTLLATHVVGDPVWRGGPQPGGTKAGDFDGDGRIDLAFIDRKENLIGWWQEHLRVWLSQGDGTFVETFDHAFDPYVAMRATTGDFTGDGLTDVVTADAAGLSVWPGTGAGLLAMPLPPVPPVGVTSMSRLLYDGDAIADLLVSSPAGRAMLLGQPGGGFVEAPLMPCSGSLYVGTDWDGDGLADLLCRDGNVIDVHLGSGPATFDPVPVTTVFPPGMLVGYTGGDVDGDGAMDLVTVVLGDGYQESEVHATRGLGDGGFAPTELIATDTGAFDHMLSSLSLMDVDQNGVEDVLISHRMVDHMFHLRMLMSNP